MTEHAANGSYLSSSTEPLAGVQKSVVEIGSGAKASEGLF